MAGEAEAVELVKKLAAASPPALGTSMGHHLLSLARAWVATYAPNVPAVVERPVAPPVAKPLPPTKKMGR